MRTGFIKFYNADRGFGFITNDDGSGDTFMHISALPKNGTTEPVLKEGQRVQFEIETSRRTGKPAAANVRMM